MKKIIIKSVLFILMLVALSAMVLSCGERKKQIIIYATSESVRIDNAQKMLNEKFPEYDIRIQYKSTGDLSAMLMGAGKNSDADIIYELETAYLEKLSENLATLDWVDFSPYLDELVPESKKYAPLIRTSGAIVVDKNALKEKNIPLPTSYDDLLKPEYKGLISMSNPATSGTGYIFYLSMINQRGVDGAIEYFDALAKNLNGAGFTTAGAGPIAALEMGEAAIGLGMTFQAVNKINEGADWEILFFEDGGSPYNTYSCALMEGRQNDEDIVKVFNYILSDVAPKDNELFTPEKIFKDKDFTVENFPENIPYANMTHITDPSKKDEFLSKWKY